MSERTWKLGEDLSPCDNLLDGVSFDDLITAVRCNCPNITRAAVHAALNEILSDRKRDMMFLVERNMDAIMAEARKGRDS